MMTIVTLLTSIIHREDDNIFHSIIILQDRRRLLQFCAMILCLAVVLLIPIAVLSFLVEDIGTTTLFDEG